MKNDGQGGPVGGGAQQSARPTGPAPITATGGVTRWRAHPDWVGAGEAVEQPQPLPPVAFT
jgi:hypothetical protein